MVNGIRPNVTPTRGLIKRYGSKFRVGSWFQHTTPEDGQRTHRAKHYKYNNKDEDNSPKTLIDKNSFFGICLCVAQSICEIWILFWLWIEGKKQAK